MTATTNPQTCKTGHGPVEDGRHVGPAAQANAGHVPDVADGWTLEGVTEWLAGAPSACPACPMGAEPAPEGDDCAFGHYAAIYDATGRLGLETVNGVELNESHSPFDLAELVAFVVRRARLALTRPGASELDRLRFGLAAFDVALAVALQKIGLRGFAVPVASEATRVLTADYRHQSAA